MLQLFTEATNKMNIISSMPQTLGKADPVINHTSLMPSRFINFNGANHSVFIKQKLLQLFTEAIGKMNTIWMLPQTLGKAGAKLNINKPMPSRFINFNGAMMSMNTSDEFAPTFYWGHVSFKYQSPNASNFREGYPDSEYQNRAAFSFYQFQRSHRAYEYQA